MGALLVQIAMGILLLAFGVLALRVWLRLRGRSADGFVRAWGVTAGSFLVIGGSTFIHSLLLYALVMWGRDSAHFAVLTSWSLAVNVGRTVSGLALPVLLAVVVWRRGALERPLASSVPITASVGIVATLAAHRLLDSTIHQVMTALAVLGALLALLLFSVLLAALIYDLLDHLLWFALAAHALKEVLHVSLLSILAWWGAAPDPLAYALFYALGLIATATMIGLALRRLSLARGHQRVPALLERLHVPRRSLIG